MSVLKDAIGGTSVGGDDDISVNSVLRCSPALSGKTDGSDLSDCVPASVDDISRAEWGWLQLRKSADLPNESEHFLIAQATASLAGFSATTLFQPFWVRYPTNNALVASPRDLDENGFRETLDPPDHLPSPYLVGQSWTPASSLTNSTQASRSISLLDLAEVPDFSSSLADWAAGNELCPIANIAGAFTPALSEDQACHEFTKVLGGINAPHFAPLNKQTWAYYHSLAIKRMKECNKLSALVAPFYTAYDPFVCPPNADPDCQDQLGAYQVLHDSVTEQHECEIEAMSYEIFAQHFLEDAWSTGHMWKRWGKANFGDFDSDVSFGPTVPSPTIPPENAAPRRATIAMLTAAISGEIHGAKSILLKKIREIAGSNQLLGDIVVDSAEIRRVADDPLNGPTYRQSLFIPAKNVEWLTGSGQFAGAGDLFWDPALPVQGAVASSSIYTQQRTQMLKCGAASMLEVYNVGPRAHGEPTENLELRDIDPGAPDCWDHWVTNDAMLGAIGVANFIYDPNAQLKVFSLANSVVLNKLKDQSGFVKDRSPDTELPKFASLRADREAFYSRLSARLNLDLPLLQKAYITNANLNPNGTESAHGIGPNGKSITMLSVDPIADPPGPETDSDGNPIFLPPTDYADALSPQSNDIGTLPAPGTLGSAMSKLFWRGNVERTCRTSLANGAQEMLSLRDACISGAAGGGRPDACTACVQLAELHIPRADLSSPLNPVLDSKCSMLGTESTSSPPAAFPTWWYDNFYRQNGVTQSNPEPPLNGGLALSGFYVAMTWCTGAELRDSVELDVGLGVSPGSDLSSTSSTNSPGRDGQQPVRDSQVRFDQTGVANCFVEDNPLLPFTKAWGISHRRHAQAFVEDFSPNSALTIFPIVSAFDYDLGFAPASSGDPCHTENIVVVDTRLTRYARAISPAPASLYLDIFQGATGISAPRCGVQQRVSFWNQSCDGVGVLLGYTAPEQDHFFPDTGAKMENVDPDLPVSDGPQKFCYVREPRMFKATCPDGFACSADGECNSSGEVPALNFVTASTPPPAIATN